MSSTPGSTGSARTTASRRGRPRRGEREARRRRILDAVVAELAACGYEKTTMLGVATRAGASKETLYSWFGNREGLFAALIEDNADASVERVRAAFDADSPPRDVLVGFASGLLRLLTDERSITLNRAAMASPDLARILVASGRRRVAPIVAGYLGRLAEDGILAAPDPADAFGLLYGLVVQDTQIDMLLGGEAPSDEVIVTRAEIAVDRFFALLDPDRPAS